MKAIRNIKEKLSRVLLSKRKPKSRNRRGFDFKVANKVIILFNDIDETRYRRIKQFSKELKDEFGIKAVKGIAFINGSDKDVPVYQAHKLEMDYFTRDDLSWNLKASQNLKSLRDERCDILIDVTELKSLHIDYFMKYASASMKVGRAGSYRESEFDLIINTPESFSTELFLNQTKEILGNLSMK